MSPDTLLAGRELDVLVAETVMRWKVDEDGCLDKGTTRIWASDWCPSTDIRAAWEVVEKLRTTYGDNSVIVQWAHETRQWVCCDHDAMTWEGAGDTAPLAICRAALAAVRAAAKEGR